MSLLDVFSYGVLTHASLVLLLTVRFSEDLFHQVWLTCPVKRVTNICPVTTGDAFGCEVDMECAIVRIVLKDIYDVY